MRVPANTLEKNTKNEQVADRSERSSSPLIMKLGGASDHSSAAENEQVRDEIEPDERMVVPRVSFSRLQSQQVAAN